MIGTNKGLFWKKLSCNAAPYRLMGLGVISGVKRKEMITEGILGATFISPFREQFVDKLARSLRFLGL